MDSDNEDDYSIISNPFINEEETEPHFNRVGSELIENISTFPQNEESNTEANFLVLSSATGGIQPQNPDDKECVDKEKKVKDEFLLVENKSDVTDENSDTSTEKLSVKDLKKKFECEGILITEKKRVTASVKESPIVHFTKQHEQTLLECDQKEDLVLAENASPTVQSDPRSQFVAEECLSQENEGEEKNNDEKEEEGNSDETEGEEKNNDENENGNLHPCECFGPGNHEHIVISTDHIVSQEDKTIDFSGDEEECSLDSNPSPIEVDTTEEHHLQDTDFTEEKEHLVEEKEEKYCARDESPVGLKTVYLPGKPQIKEEIEMRSEDYEMDDDDEENFELAPDNLDKEYTDCSPNTKLLSPQSVPPADHSKETSANQALERDFHFHQQSDHPNVSKQMQSPVFQDSFENPMQWQRAGIPGNFDQRTGHIMTVMNESVNRKSPQPIYDSENIQGAEGSNPVAHPMHAGYSLLEQQGIQSTVYQQQPYFDPATGALSPEHYYHQFRSPSPRQGLRCPPHGWENECHSIPGGQFPSPLTKPPREVCFQSPSGSHDYSSMKAQDTDYRTPWSPVSDHNKAESSDKAQESPKDKLLRVDGVDQEMDLEVLQMYFENKKKSGGGPIKKITDHLSQGYVLLTFEDPEVSDCVLEHEHMLLKKKLRVSIYTETIPVEQPVSASCTIEVRGGEIVTDKEVMELYFESPKSGGGEIQKIEVDQESCVAYITFTEDKVANQVLKRNHVLNGVRLIVTPYTSAVPCEKPKTIHVSGLKKNVTKELIEMYFESKRSGGGDIENITMNENKGEALITFVDPSVVPNILKKQHQISNCKLTVTLASSKTLGSTFKDPSSQKVQGQLSVEVRGLDEKTNENLLINYFENQRRSGGGEVEKVDFSPKTGRAVLTFKDAVAVSRVLSKKHSLDGKNLTVSPYTDTSATAPTIDTSHSLTISIQGLNSSTTKDTLMNYFENKRRSGGGEVSDVKVDSKKGEAFITFEDKEAVTRVLSKKHSLDGKNLTVSLYTDTSSSAPTADTSHSLTISIQGLKSSTTEDTLINYFENKRRSGGGPVSNVKVDSRKGEAFITFEDKEAVTGVLSRKHTLDGSQLKISLFAQTASSQNIPEDLTTVAIRGFSPLTSSDTFLNYFENTRRSGGGPVTEIKIDLKKGVAFITFEDADVAAKVANRDHKLDDMNLKIQLEKPPGMMKDRVVIHGWLDAKSSDEILNFVEAKTMLDVEKIMFGDDEGVAMVIFKNDIDFQKVQTDLTKKQPPGKILTIEPVPTTSAVLVRNLPQNPPPSKDTITNFFENERKTGGGEVTDVTFGENDEYAIVTFANIKDAVSVVKREQKMQDTNLELSLFTECLGISGGSAEPLMKLPEPIAISQDDQFKIVLVKHVSEMKISLESLLQEHNAYLDWSKSLDCVHLACSLTPETPNSRQLVKTWAKEAMHVLQEYMKTVTVHTVKVTGEEFSEAEPRLKEIAGVTRIGIYFDEAKGVVFIFWDSKEMCERAQEMEAVIRSTKEMLQRKNNEKCETIQIKRGTLRLLEKHQIGREVLQKYPLMTASYNFDSCCMEIKGVIEEILEMKLSINKTLNSITSHTHCWESDVVKQFLTWPEIRSIFENTCQGQSKGVVEITASGFEVLAFDREEADTMLINGQNCVQQQVIVFNEDNEIARNAPGWTELKHSIQERNKGLLLMHEDNHSLTMVGVSQTFQHHFKSLKEYLDDNNIQQSNISLDTPFGQMFFSYLQENLEDNRRYGGNIRIEEISLLADLQQISFTANKAGVERVKAIRSKFDQNLVCIQKKFTQPCMNQFLESSDWKLKCKEIEQKFRCRILKKGECPEGIIEKSFDDQYYFEEPNIDFHEFDIEHSQKKVPTSASKKPSRRSSTRPGTLPKPAKKERRPMPSKPRIFLNKMSDITKEEHDVLVNSTNPSLSLNDGQVSKALLAVGGQVIQDECKQKYPKGIAEGEIAITTGGKLMCKKLFHCTLKTEKDLEKIETTISETVTKCLTEADKLGYHSIGFPALGTGNLGYPAKLVAHAMYEATIKYGLEHPECKVSDVLFIVHKKDENVISVFKAEEDKYKQLIKESHQQPEDEFITAMPDIPVGEGIKTYAHFEESRSNVDLVFAACSKYMADQAERELLDMYTKKIVSMTHDIPLLQQWDQHYIDLLVGTCKGSCIDVSFNFTMSHITLRGLAENVHRVSIHQTVKDAEQAIQNKKNAILIAQQVQWNVIVVGEYGEELEPYSQLNNYEIEMDYRNGRPRVVIMDPDSHQPVIIDFTRMEEFPEDLKSEDDFPPVRVIRKDLIQETAVDAPLPAEWKPMNTETLDVVLLQTDSADYIRVSQMFKDSYDQPSVQIVKIERIQNVTLYKQYMAMKKQIESRLPTNRRCERDRLWHGTHEDAVQGIVQYGFNRSYSDLNRSAHGQGVYFATKADYSSRDSYAKANAVGERRIFLCKALVGEYVKGDPTMRVLPEVPTDKGRFYNSAVDDDKEPTIFVIFSDVQAYPEYLIVFK